MSPRKPGDLEPGPTVLVIDDDEAVRSSLEMLPEAYGFQVVLARDGRQRLAAFRANAPDVVLIDLMMPMQDGLETIALIRRDWPKVRVVAMSGGAGIGHWDGLAAARKLRADYAIEKPFEADEPLAILREATAGNRARDGAMYEADKLRAITEETARRHRELDAIESDLTRVVEMFLEATGRSDLAIGFVQCLGNRRGTLH